MNKTKSIPLEEKIRAWESTKKSNYQASMRLEGIELKLDLTTLKVLYRQMKSYEDKMWIGFLISREEKNNEPKANRSDMTLRQTWELIPENQKHYIKGLKTDENIINSAESLHCWTEVFISQGIKYKIEGTFSSDDFEIYREVVFSETL